MPKNCHLLVLIFLSPFVLVTSSDFQVMKALRMTVSYLVSIHYLLLIGVGVTEDDS